MVGGLPAIPKPTYETVNIGTTNFIGEVKQTGYGSSTITTQVEYDKNGNITKYGNTTYVYDSLNRLTRENNADLNKTFVYTYNGVGNLFRRKEYSFTTGTISGDPINTRTFIYGEWNDQLVGYRDSSTNELTSFTYDDAGRMTQKVGSQAFEWDASGRLKKVSNINSTGTYSFENVYGSDGNRVARINYSANSNDEVNSNKEHFRYINGKLVYQVHETNGSDPYAEIYYLYNSTGIVGFYCNNNQYNNEEHNYELYTYRKNIFGDIVEIYKGAELVAKYIYDAWGNHKVCNPDDSENPNDSFIGNINPFRYRGYFYDVTMGLYYLKSRYYDPKIARFISPDGVEYLEPDNVNGLNLYAYCYNNPIMYVDNIGNLPLPIDIITSVIGYSADLYSFVLKLSLKSIPELSMSAAKKLARKAGHTNSARSFIRAQHNSIVKTQNLRNSTKSFSKYWGRAILAADLLWTIGENYASGDPNWISDSIVDVGISIGIYAIGTIPCVGWAFAIGAVILTEVFDDKIEEFKDWFANEWNEFWSFSWTN